MIALRPLAFGELFDRAIAIGIRNASTLAIVAFLPLLLAIWADLSAVLQVATLRGAWTFHPAHVAPVAGPAPLERFGLLFLMSLVATFVAAVIASGMTRLREDGRIDARDHATVASAWWPLLWVAITVFVAAFPESLALSRHAIFGWLLWLPIEAWLTIPLTVAACAVAVQRSSARDAIATAFRWVSGPGLGRSIALAAALCTFDVVRAIVEMLLVGSAIGLHLDWTIVPVTATIDALAQTFVILVVAVYYFDLRVVRDGFGLT